MLEPLRRFTGMADPKPHGSAAAVSCSAYPSAVAPVALRIGAGTGAMSSASARGIALQRSMKNHGSPLLPGCLPQCLLGLQQLIICHCYSLH